MKKMSQVDWVAWVFVVLGAVNWGLLGVSRINLVESLVGTGALAQVVYILIGLSGVYVLWMALSKKK